MWCQEPSRELDADSRDNRASRTTNATISPGASRTILRLSPRQLLRAQVLRRLLRRYHGAVVRKKQTVRRHRHRTTRWVRLSPVGAMADTVGVGTSVFMAYFFLRHQREHPETTTFVVISYGKRSQIVHALEWKTTGNRKVTELDVDRVDAKIRQYRYAMFLLDGPPMKMPLMVHRFVVFTSPNEDWFRDMRGDASHITLYMPLWTVGELKTAVEALELGGDLGQLAEALDFPRSTHAAYADEVVYRFAVFGGVARPCLATEEAAVLSHLQDLNTAAAAVDMATGEVIVVKGNGGKDGKELGCLLYHCIPAPHRFSPNVQIGSPYVTQLLSTRVNSLSDHDKSQLELAANWCPKVAALRQSMLKIKALSLFEESVELVANSLAHDANSSDYDLKLKLQLDESVMKTVVNQLGLMESKGACFIPPSNAFKSIDAFCLTKPKMRRGDSDSDSTVDESDSDSENTSTAWQEVELVVFQVAGKNEHKVNGNELFALVEQLKCNRDAPSRVALVFIVAGERAGGFNRQKIEGTIPLNGGFPVTAVDGVTPEMAATLEAAKITTVRDLRELSVALDEEQQPVYERAQANLRFQENKAVVAGGANHQMLQQIPHFVGDRRVSQRST